MTPEPELRLWGDPLRQDAPSQSLRQLLALASTRGLSCGLCLSAARGEVSGRAVPLTNGNRQFLVYTPLEEVELRSVLLAGNRAVSSSAPLVVFGSALDVRQAALEFHEASWVLAAEDQRVDVLLEQVLGYLAYVEPEAPEHGVKLDRLQPYLEVQPATRADSYGCMFLHVGGTADMAAGTDLVLAAFGEVWPESPAVRLEIWLPERDVFREQRLLAVLDGDARAAVSFRAGAPGVEDLRRAAALVQPLRETQLGPDALGFLVRAMASARPVVASRFKATAKVLSAHGICYPVGGRQVGDRFEPDPRMVAEGMRAVMAEPAKAREVAMRARAHVRTHLVTGRPRRVAAEPRVGTRPLVVLEAPLFETSSSALTAIETARALQRRDRVDLRLRPMVPFQEDLAAFNRQAPSLVPLLSRRPAHADLWLSSGWPPRTSRPDATRFCVRLDWEYGALPAELSPMVTEADALIVHSRAVRRTLAAAGCNLDRVELCPHGVDAEVFHEEAPPLESVLEFKRGRKALLFVGGLIWRKGVDLLLKSLLSNYRRDDGVCLVVKSMGASSSYHGYSMEELVHRVREHSGAPEIMLLEGTLEGREMAGLYTACDLLVHPYRGEGFGMPALEARACGLPMVITRGGSTDDFCVADGCLGIPAVRRLVELGGVHIGRPFVLEPDADALGQLVRIAVARLGTLQQVARREAAAVRAEYTWDRAAECIERMAYAAVDQATEARTTQTPRTTVTVAT